MKNRVLVYPPNGGEPIEVYRADIDRLVNNGWSVDSPTEKAEITATETEGKTDGNSKGKRRNR